MANRTATLVLDDGRTFTGVPVTFQTNLALERVMVKKRWDQDKHPFSITAFMVTDAIRRAGIADELPVFEELLPHIVDASLDEDQTTDDGDDDETGVDPTHAAPGTDWP